MNKREIGKRGEEIALEYLKKNKYKIIFKNYRTNFGEIDLIAINKKFLVFIEVKMRKKDSMVNVLYSVNKDKQEKIIKVAEEFLQTHQEFKNYDIRFDTVLIEGEDENRAVTIIKNAFLADKKINGVF